MSWNDEQAIGEKVQRKWETDLDAAKARIEELEGHRKQWRRIAANYHDVARRALNALEVHDGELAVQLRDTLTTDEASPSEGEERP